MCVKLDKSQNAQDFNLAPIFKQVYIYRKVVKILKTEKFQSMIHLIQHFLGKLKMLDHDFSDPLDPAN